MRQRLRSHLTYANVMATLAVFLVLGGGTALAAYVVSSNSQIGPDTISGHKPPSGKHSNIIAGSINGQDVLENALGGRVIAEPTLTGNARKLIFNSFTHDPIKIATVGPYTIKASCDNPSPASYVLGVYVNGPAGTADYSYTNRVNDTGQPEFGSGTANVPANQDAPILFFLADTSYQVPPHGDFQRYAGTAMLRTGSVLVQIDFNAVVDATFPRTFPQPCFFYGTGTKAT
jgi:hypothetical protein